MRLAGRGTTGSIRYPLAERFADWYHGLRDGRAGIPDRTMATRYITTRHREMLMALARPRASITAVSVLSASVAVAGLLAAPVLAASGNGRVPVTAAALTSSDSRPSRSVH